MAEARLKPGIWVKAQLRLCDRAGLTLTVLRRGDDDGGSIVLKILGADGRADLLTQTTAPAGGRAWLRPLGPEPVDESEADAYIARQGEFDPDIWALEVIDRAGLYEIDGEVIEGY
ncbi:MAG: DUF1491 family protein [Alphaproteobacteria bacterium]|nr:DUF1491 family protein [Alphaproteobacteria bacterium]